MLFERIVLALEIMIVLPHSTSSPGLGFRVDFQGQFSSFLHSFKDIFHADSFPVPLVPTLTATRNCPDDRYAAGDRQMPSVKMAAAALLCPFLTSAKTTSFETSLFPQQRWSRRFRFRALAVVGVSDTGPGEGISAGFLLHSGMSWEGSRETRREGRSDSRDTLFHEVSRHLPSPSAQAPPTAPSYLALEFSSGGGGGGGED